MMCIGVFLPANNFRRVQHDLVELTNTASVEESLNNDFELHIYPNPAIKYVNVSLEEVRDDATVQIYSITGSLVKEKAVARQRSFKMNVRDLQEGIYLLNILSRTQTETQKIQIIR